MTAPQAAGVIHTDFEKGFIRAQTISYQNLIDSGSIVNAKNKGLLRSEGKEYVVKDGDIIHFKLMYKNNWLFIFKDYHSTIGYVAQMVRAQHS